MHKFKNKINMINKYKCLKLIVWTLYSTMNILVFLGYNRFDHNSKKFVKLETDLINPEFDLYLYIDYNPMKLCQNKQVLIFAYVLTKVDDFKKRSLIRKTWANTTLFPDLKVLFIVGKSFKAKVNDLILEEQLEFNDLLQGNFIDSFKNLTYKSLIAWKWISTYCSQAKYVIKLDDDLFLNNFNLINYLQSTNEIEIKTFYCNVLRSLSLNEPKNPTLCMGAYLMTSDLISRLYYCSFNVKTFWLENVYTSLVANRIGDVSYVDISSKFIAKASLKYEKDYFLIKNVSTEDDFDFVMKYVSN